MPLLVLGLLLKRSKAVRSFLKHTHFPQFCKPQELL